MRSINQALFGAVLSLLSVTFFPLNFALVVAALISFKRGVAETTALIISSSLFLSLFGNLNFGLVLLSFTASLAVAMIGGKMLPRNIYTRAGVVLVILALWEILLRLWILIPIGRL